MNSSFQVFVYGTLKPGEVNYPVYCEGKVTQAVSAYVLGELYHLKSLGYPALTEGHNQVQGYLLTFEEGTALAHLDSLETYDSQRLPSENEYNRIVAEVYNSLTHQSLGKAWVYQMDLEKIRAYGGEYLSSGIWQGQFID